MEAIASLSNLPDRAPVASLYQECDYCSSFVAWSTKPGGSAGMSFYDIDQKFNDYKRHINSQKCKKFAKSNVHVGNGTPSGCFAFTITKSDKDPYSVGDMLTAVRKIMRQKSCPVKKYAWYYEEKGRDDNGDPIHPHIHGLYETESGGRIETKQFKRAWEIWDPSKPIGAGFRGGYHRPVRSNEGYSDYIKKDGGMSESFGMD